jgi:hypothetical protein
MYKDRLSSQDAHTTDFLDFPLSTGTEELGLHDDGDLGEVSSSENLVVSLHFIY